MCSLIWTSKFALRNSQTLNPDQEKEDFKMREKVSSGVKTEEIREGRIWAGLMDIWSAFLEILPLHKSNEKQMKT